MREFLVMDGEPRADEVFDAARREIVSHVLRTGVDLADVLWDVSEYEDAISTLVAVRDAGLDADITKQVLREAARIGEREMAYVKDVTDEYDGWSPDEGLDRLVDSNDLKSIALALEEHVPATLLWKEAVWRHRTVIATAMREYAYEAATKHNDWDGAGEVLQLILDTPELQVAHSRARRDHEIVEEQRNQTESAAFSLRLYRILEGREEPNCDEELITGCMVAATKSSGGKDE